MKLPKQYQYASAITLRMVAGLKADDSHRRATGNRSILSKMFKTRDNKAAARVRRENNHRLRADLQSQKANEANPDKRATLQAQISKIGVVK